MGHGFHGYGVLNCWSFWYLLEPSGSLNPTRLLWLSTGLRKDMFSNQNPVMSFTHLQLYFYKRCCKIWHLQCLNLASICRTFMYFVTIFLILDGNCRILNDLHGNWRFLSVIPATLGQCQRMPHLSSRSLRWLLLSYFRLGERLREQSCQSTCLVLPLLPFALPDKHYRMMRK